MVIIVTGAGKGIGFEVVKKFADNPNNKIIAISRHTVSIEKLAENKRGAQIIPYSFDLSEFDKYKELTEFISAQTNHIDVLLLNAGALVKGPFSELSLADAHRVFDVNFFSVFLTIRNLLPLMGKKATTHVVTVSSMAGFQGSSKFPGLCIYGASKSAVIGLTEGLAAEYKNSGISFNSLAFGAVETDMLKTAFPGLEAPLKAFQMAEFVADFCTNGHKYFNGKVLPVSLSTP